MTSTSIFLSQGIGIFYGTLATDCSKLSNVPGTDCIRIGDFRCIKRIFWSSLETCQSPNTSDQLINYWCAAEHADPYQ
jgi:hypothetical protein